MLTSGAPLNPVCRVRIRGVCVLSGVLRAGHTASMTHRIVLVGFDGVQSLDLAGPADAFAGASELAPEPYEVVVAAVRPGRLETSGPLTLWADRGLDELDGPLDTVLVAGGRGSHAAARDPALIRWLADAAGRTRRMGSVCTGSFVLAAAGLLDGRRATTHWAWCAELSRKFPQIAVDPEPVFVRDGPVVTSAGVTAGIDLALALIEEDWGQEVARTVARYLVVYVQRPSGQPQLSAALQAQLAQRPPLRDLQLWILEHPTADLSVPSLARRVGVSPRHFSRRFAREVGIPPGLYVQRARVEVARRRLEASEEGIEALAMSCGFGGAEAMRRAFLRQLGVTPAAYRRRFRRIP